MGYRDYATAKAHIVDTNGHGDFTTIASALTAASSGQTIFIMPGTYTENLTLKAGVNLVAFNADAFTPNVTIVGKASFSAAGTVSISGIKLQTNSDFFLSMTGSNATNVYLVNCYLNNSNNTGINYAVTNVSAGLFIFACWGDCGATGTLFTSSSTGTLRIHNTTVDNSGGSTTASSASGNFAHVSIVSGFFKIPFSQTSGGRYNFSNCFLECIDINTTVLTTSGTGTTYIYNCILDSGSAAALSIGSGTTVTAASNAVYSSATNVFTGAGTVNTGGNVCVVNSGNNVSTINHLTVI